MQLITSVNACLVILLVFFPILPVTACVERLTISLNNTRQNSKMKKLNKMHSTKMGTYNIFILMLKNSQRLFALYRAY